MQFEASPDDSFDGNHHILYLRIGAGCLIDLLHLGLELVAVPAPVIIPDLQQEHPGCNSISKPSEMLPFSDILKHVKRIAAS